MTDMELIQLIRKSSHNGHGALIKEYSKYVDAIVYNKLRQHRTKSSDVLCAVLPKRFFVN